jgi:hypothetical protein
MKTLSFFASFLNSIRTYLRRKNTEMPGDRKVNVMGGRIDLLFYAMDGLTE